MKLSLSGVEKIVRGVEASRPGVEKTREGSSILKPTRSGIKKTREPVPWRCRKNGLRDRKNARGVEGFRCGATGFHKTLFLVLAPLCWFSQSTFSFFSWPTPSLPLTSPPWVEPLDFTKHFSSFFLASYPRSLVRHGWSHWISQHAFFPRSCPALLVLSIHFFCFFVGPLPHFRLLSRRGWSHWISQNTFPPFSWPPPHPRSHT